MAPSPKRLASRAGRARAGRPLPGGAAASLTLEEHLERFAPGIWERGVPEWPPDLFALAGVALHKSGAYTMAVSSWPPKRLGGRRTSGWRTWAEKVRAVGDEWRTRHRAPEAVREQWRCVERHRTVQLSGIGARAALSSALIQLVAYADEASAGFGLPVRGDGSELEESFAVRAWRRLFSRHPQTLCEAIGPDAVRVLPKQHTPQVGITFRSLSHNLALCFCGDVNPVWNWFGFPEDRGKEDSLNLLLIPWPQDVAPSDFRTASPSTGPLPEMADGFGFFEFRPRHRVRDVTAAVMSLMKDAEARLGSHVDGVIFPELALSERDHRRLQVKVARRGAFLLAGIAGKETNRLAFSVPLNEQYVVEMEQHKHHRWRLTESQIRQYALHNQLDRRKLWWEHIKLQPRRLTFHTIRSWLTMCFLICEDLARQEPVSEMIRAIGPNLVIALLLDGPQLEKRWFGRYASVLAEDPGSSVLTLTSVGIAELCQPPSRVIALWKDPVNGASELALPPGADALAITLGGDRQEEWSADGRSDGRVTGRPVLISKLPLYLKKP